MPWSHAAAISSRASPRPTWLPKVTQAPKDNADNCRPEAAEAAVLHARFLARRTGAESYAPARRGRRVRVLRRAGGEPPRCRHCVRHGPPASREILDAAVAARRGHARSRLRRRVAGRAPARGRRRDAVAAAAGQRDHRRTVQRNADWPGRRGVRQRVRAGLAGAGTAPAPLPLAALRLRRIRRHRDDAGAGDARLNHLPAGAQQHGRLVRLPARDRADGAAQRRPRDPVRRRAGDRGVRAADDRACSRSPRPTS